MELQSARESYNMYRELQTHIASSPLVRDLVFNDPRYQQRLMYMQGTKLLEAYRREVMAGISDPVELNRAVIVEALLAREKRLERRAPRFVDPRVNGKIGHCWGKEPHWKDLSLIQVMGQLEY